MKSSKETRIEYINEKFKTLVHHAQDIIFPDQHQGIFARQSTDGWSSLRKLIYRAFHPMWEAENRSAAEVFLFSLFSLYVPMFSLALSMYFTSIVLGETAAVESSNTTIFFIKTISIFVSVFLMLPTIHWWGEVVLEKRYSKGVKLFVFCLFSYLSWIVTKAIIAQSPLYWPSREIISQNINFFLVISFFFVFPSYTFLLSIVIDYLLVIGYFLRVLFFNISSIHDPLPLESVEKLVKEKFSSAEEGDTEWQLCSLSKLEIKSLHNRALANLAGTEKRTIPISLILALIGLLTFSKFFGNNVDQLLSDMFNKLNAFTPLANPLEFIFPMIVIGGLFIIGGFLILSLNNLFTNIVVQNIIIEACIIVEYAIDEEIKKQKAKQNKPEKIKGFFKSLFN